MEKVAARAREGACAKKNYENKEFCAVGVSVRSLSF